MVASLAGCWVVTKAGKSVETRATCSGGWLAEWLAERMEAMLADMKDGWWAVYSVA